SHPVRQQDSAMRRCFDGKVLLRHHADWRPGTWEYLGHCGQLRSRYDDLIREALLHADPTLEIMRADDVSAPGAITSDILTRLMHAEIVVADITFPNPNVFYELGLRHACRSGTIII